MFQGVQMAFPRGQAQVQGVGNTELGWWVDVTHLLDEMEADVP